MGRVDNAAPRSALPADFGRPEQPQQVEYTAPTLDAAPGSDGVEHSRGAFVGGGATTAAEPQNRNDLCSCGSGRKYKRCHGAGRA